MAAPTCNVGAREITIVDGAFGCGDFFKSAVGVAVVDRFAAWAGDLSKMLALIVGVGGLFVQCACVALSQITAVVAEAMCCRGRDGTGKQVAVGIVGKALFGAVGVGDLNKPVHDVVAIACRLPSWVCDGSDIAVSIVGIGGAVFASNESCFVLGVV